MKNKFLFLLLIVFGPYLVNGQGIRPEQIRKETGSDKQKILMSDATTGVYSSTSDGIILPYDTQRGVDGDYDINDLVTFGGYLYRSQVNNNVTTPGVGSWELIGAGSPESIGPTVEILRVFEVGQTITATTPGELLEWMSFAAPTITLNLSPSTTVYEVGTSTAITLSVATTNPGAATLSNGTLTRTSPASNVIHTFGASISYSTGITFAPTQSGTGDYNQQLYSFQATQDWTGSGESGTASSTTRTVRGVYPVLYGVSATDLSATGNPYTALSKLVETEGNKSELNMNGTGYSYFAIPKTWSDYDLSKIEDHNPFDVTASYTAYDITITSSGLTNNWTAVPYKLYKSNTTSTFFNYAYSIYR